jgi:transposase
MHDDRPSTVTAPSPATLFVALDLSRSSWVVAVHAPHAAGKVSRHKLAPGAEGLLALISRVREQAERALGAPVRVASCHEAGRDGFWLHRVLQKAGIENRVIDPASLLVDRRARRAKTDRLDAEALLRALMALCRGEPRVCAVVRAPSVEEEDARRTTRERANLLKERVRHVNRIKGLLATQGIDDYQPLRPDRLERLGALVTGDGRPLPERLAAEVRRHLRRLELVLEMLDEVEAERDRATAAAPGKAAALLRLKGLGAESAAVLGAEVFYRSFANRRGVAAYAGLVPSPFASGDSCRDQGVSKAGNPRVRRMMVELAWLWVRFQPESALSQWFVARVGAAKGRVRRIAIVALARKLLVALWRYVETGLVPTGAVLKA